MKKIKLILASLSVMLGLGIGVLAVQPVYAIDCSGTECIGDGLDDANDGNPTDLNGLIKDVVNILLYIVGAAAVIMIVIGGIRYVTSNGEQAQVTAAKNTILYSVVGLVVAALAFAIVNFVLVSLGL